MPKNQLTWILKTNTGKLKGPYSTSDVVQMIKLGQISGQEMISQYPDGKWTYVSKEPEFYDEILASLESDAQKAANKSKEMGIKDDTIFMPAPTPKKEKANDKKLEGIPSSPLSNSAQSDQQVSSSFGNKDDKFISNSNQSRGSSSSGSSKSTVQSRQHPIIELSDLKKVGRKKKQQGLLMPIVLFAATALAIWFFILSDGTKDTDKIRLLSPSQKGVALSDDDLKKRLAESLQLVELSTTESYYAAHKILVSLVEASPQNLEIRGLLCLSYKELWPYSFQDTKDQKTVASFAQATRSLNLASSYGGLCDAVKLITMGRFREARSVVDAVLDTGENFSLLSVLYYLKGELLDGERDLINSGPYLEKAHQIWERWHSPQLALASLLVKNREFTQAAGLYKEILAKNPKNKRALVNLGLIEYRNFKQVDTAFKDLQSAINTKSRILKSLESEAYEVLAMIFADRGQNDQAREAAETSLKLNPSNINAKQLVVRFGGNDKVAIDKSNNAEMLFNGDQYMRQGDYLSAQAEYKAAFEANPKNGQAAVKAAKALWLLNQGYDAIDWLNKAIKAEPTLVSAYVLQSDYQAQRYDFLAATVALQTASKIASQSYEVLRGFSLLEYRKGNMQAAISYGLRSLKAYDGDLDTYILLSKANATLAQSLSPLTKKEAERRDQAAKDAIRFATKAVEIDSTSSDAQINYAKTLAIANGVDSGVSYMNEMIKKFSYNLDYRVALAEIYRAEERYSQAKDLYEQVTEADPRNKKAFLGLGECYRALGMVDKSLKAFLNAAVIDPTDAEGLFQAGKVYQETSRYSDAIEQFKRVQKINPNYPKTNYQIGRASFSTSNFEEALKYATLEKKANPNIADPYLLSAEVFMARRQYAECASEYSQALKLRSSGAEAYVKAAACYRLSGNIDVAENMLELASARESGYAEIYRELGAIYEVKGDARAAGASYNKYLGLSPNAPDKPDVERRLMKLGY